MELVGWTPARLPDRAPIEGETVRLVPIDANRDSGQLYAAVEGADDLWRYLPYGPFGSHEAFTRWVTELEATDDPMFFAIVDRGTSVTRGIASYLRMVPQHGVIEIGHLLFTPALQRTRQATEAIYVMSRHAFDDLGYRRLEWKCNALNEPSRRAADRFGFTFEGVFRHHMVVKGRNRDTAWYSITDGEWPSRRGAFEAWLAPENFDASGRQRRALTDYRMR